MQSIDTHVHFWKYDSKRDSWITDDMKLLKADYLPEQLAGTLKRNEVSAVVAVQASQSELETRFLVELSKTHPIIQGVVGWVDLQADNIDERLAHFSQFPVIKGWRHIIQAEPEDFCARKNFQRGIAALQLHHYSYDLLLYEHQLPGALELVSRFPDQAFVIDHCAKPKIRDHHMSEWKRLIQQMASHPLVYCKLSGLLTEATWSTWSPRDFYPYLDTVFECFGPDRLMFGSDWPVLLLSGMYIQWKSLLEKYVGRYPVEDAEKIFRTNAQRFYRLN